MTPIDKTLKPIAMQIEIIEMIEENFERKIDFIASEK
jgi:hypothetical protein